jgi:hypothetical protein
MKSPTQTHDQDELVIEKNALVHSRQTFTLFQQRILALAMAQIERSDEGDKTYQIKIQDLVDLSNTKDLYNRLERETRDLVGKVVTRKVKNREYESFEHWAMVSHTKHVKGSGVLEIRFDSEVRDMLFQLEGEWTATVALELASCQSSYSVRIMKMLMSHWRYGKWEVSVKELRFYLGLENKYKSFTNFRTRVLEKAQQDLQKHTNMRFTWQEQKNAHGRGKGRKITHIKFDFSWKPNQLNLPMDGSEPTGKPDIEFKYNLEDRLKNTLQLDTEKRTKIKKWLGDHPAQQYPLSYWIHRHIEVPQPPRDLLGNPVQSVPNWSWKLISKAMKGEGFPQPKNKPKSQNGPTPKFEKASAPPENNPFTNMYPGNNS